VLDDIEWWHSPDLAYRKGWEDGQEALVADWAGEYPHHVHRALEAVQAADARAEADQPGTRVGDFAGIGDLNPTRRRDLYKSLLESWEVPNA